MAAVDSAEGLFASKAGRALAFACSFIACLLAAGVLAITLFGRPRPPAIILELTQNMGPQAKGAAPAIPGLTEGAIIGRVTEPIYAGKALLADPDLVENTAQGPLPRIADDGRTPMTAYAGAVPAGAKFKIALVVSGLGLSAIATKSALDSLPAGITLGFAPYAGDVGQWAAEARRKPAMKSCWKSPWSPMTSPTAIRARTPCAPARKKKPISSA